MLYAFGFERIGVVASDLYFVDPNPGPGQEGPEQGVRVEVRLLEPGELRGSIYSARPIGVEQAIWRADLLESVANPGSLDRAHHHPRFTRMGTGRAPLREGDDAPTRSRGSASTSPTSTASSPRPAHPGRHRGIRRRRAPRRDPRHPRRGPPPPRPRRAPASSRVHRATKPRAPASAGSEARSPATRREAPPRWRPCCSASPSSQCLSPRHSGSWRFSLPDWHVSPVWSRCVEPVRVDLEFHADTTEQRTKWSLVRHRIADVDTNAVPGRGSHSGPAAAALREQRAHGVDRVGVGG